MGELTERDEDIIRTSVNFRSKYNEATLLWKKKRSSILVNCPECVSREVEKKKKETRARSAPVDEGPVDQPLFERLRRLRRELADADAP